MESDDPDEIPKPYKTESICLEADETEDVNLETFSLIWLDPTVNSDKLHLDAQKRLRALINHLVTFDNMDECREYINHVPSDHYLVLIVSGQLGQQLVPRIHHIHQVFSIYVFCANKALHEKWTQKFKKVRLF
jgi:hypothetical protein